VPAITWTNALDLEKVSIMTTMCVSLSAGSGKSTLLKILGGKDTDYDGEFRVFPNVRVGYFEQEPQLDPDKNVYENIVADVRDQLDLLAEYQQVLSQLPCFSRSNRRSVSDTWRANTATTISSRSKWPRPRGCQRRSELR